MFHKSRRDSLGCDTETHPLGLREADECFVNWIGSGLSLISGEYVATGPFDVVLAPCGVQHGGKIPAEANGAALRRRQRSICTFARRTTRTANISRLLSRCSRQSRAGDAPITRKRASPRLATGRVRTTGEPVVGPPALTLKIRPAGPQLHRLQFCSMI